jgi:hypothetical protein
MSGADVISMRDGKPLRGPDFEDDAKSIRSFATRAVAAMVRARRSGWAADYLGAAAAAREITRISAELAATCTSTADEIRARHEKAERATFSRVACARADGLLD